MREDIYEARLEGKRISKGSWWYTLRRINNRFFYHINCSDFRSFGYDIKSNFIHQIGGGTMIMPKTIEKEFLEKIQGDAEKYNFDEKGNLRRFEIIDFDGTHKIVENNSWSKTMLIAVAETNRFVHKVIYNGEVIYKNDVFKEQS